MDDGSLTDDFRSRIERERANLWSEGGDFKETEGDPSKSEDSSASVASSDSSHDEEEVMGTKKRDTNIYDSSRAVRPHFSFVKE